MSEWEEVDLPLEKEKKSMNQEGKSVWEPSKIYEISQIQRYSILTWINLLSAPESFSWNRLNSKHAFLFSSTKEANLKEKEGDYKEGIERGKESGRILSNFQPLRMNGNMKNENDQNPKKWRILLN